MERQLNKKVADLASQVKVLEKRLGLFKLENQNLVSRQCSSFFLFYILYYNNAELVFCFYKVRRFEKSNSQGIRKR